MRISQKSVFHTKNMENKKLPVETRILKLLDEHGSVLLGNTMFHLQHRITSSIVVIFGQLFDELTKVAIDVFNLTVKHLKYKKDDFNIVTWFEKLRSSMTSKL